MKRILVTGASGFLGWNLCNTVFGDWEVFGTAFSHQIEIPKVNIIQVDLTKYQDLKRVFHDLRPDAVIHTAAASKPNYCQNNREAAYKINVEASANIAGLCSDSNIPFVFTSSDMVFDGLNPPYKEQDPICPLNVYGEQKSLAEESIKSRHPKATICRMPLMFGQAPTGSTPYLQTMLKSMREGQELKLFADEYRTPISAKTAVSGLLVALDNPGTLLHLGGNERVSRYDFGILTAKVFQIQDARIEPCSSKDIVMEAPRAPDLSMDNAKARALGFAPSSLEEALRELAGIL